MALSFVRVLNKARRGVVICEISLSRNLADPYFHLLSEHMSGHSKWATIKRQKGANDAARGKIFTKLIRELSTAAKLGGGDPDGNARLRKAIADCRAKQMPADNIKRAIQRGTGELDGANYDEVLYEGTGPGGTLFLVEGMTDNRNRTAPELRRIFEKRGGNMGGTGTAGWAFERFGTIVLDKAAVSEEQLMEIALEAGVDDYRDDGETWLVCTPVSDLFDVLAQFEKSGLPIVESGLGFVPNNKKTVTGEDARKCLELAEALDDHDDVQGVFFDFEVSDDELTRILGS